MTTEALTQRKAQILANLSDSLKAVQSAREVRDNLIAKSSELEASKPAGHAAINLQALLSKRQNLRASIALGESTEAELLELDKEIAKTEKTKAQESALLASISETIAGIRERINQANTSLADREKTHKDYSLAYLEIMADISASRFKELADTLIAEHDRIKAFDKLFNLSGKKRLLSTYNGLTIPSVLGRVIPTRSSEINSNGYYYLSENDPDNSTSLLNLKEEIKSVGAILA